MKNIPLSIIFQFLAIISIAQNTDLKIQYKIHTATQKVGEGEFIDSNGIPEPTNYTEWVKLQNNSNFILYNETPILKQYNFSTEMIYHRNKNTLFDAYPVYSVIDNRVAEFKNRMYLNDILKAGGAENVMGDIANLESIFGLEFPENHIADSITTTAKKDTVIYQFDEEVLVKVLYGKFKLSAEYRDAYAKYIIYNFEIHPFIKKQIYTAKKLPLFIEFSYTNVGMRTTKSYHLVETELAEHTPFDINALQKNVSPFTDSKMNQLIDSMNMTMLFDTIPPPDSTIYFEKAAQLSGTGNHLSGLLCLLEYLLSSGNQPATQIREIIAPNQKTDTTLATFLYCLNTPQTKEDAEKKIALLNQLIDLNLDYGYVMNIFAANYTQPISQTEAINYFYNALSENPEITGAWLDLGKIYANQYHYQKAWKCFSIMKSLNFSHRMTKQVLDMQMELKSKHPNYFLLEE